MNRGELAEMRQRLSGRSAAVGQDSVLLLWVVAVLWVLLVFLMSFL